MRFPKVGRVVFCKVNVALFETSTVPVTENPDGIVKLHVFVPSPVTILEVGSIDQFPVMVAVALF